jgi:21S rRNA (GM2251-2'-O)-methyltransferase
MSRLPLRHCSIRLFTLLSAVVGAMLFLLRTTSVVAFRPSSSSSVIGRRRSAAITSATRRYLSDKTNSDIETDEYGRVIRSSSSSSSRSKSASSGGGGWDDFEPDFTQTPSSRSSSSSSSTGGWDDFDPFDDNSNNSNNNNTPRKSPAQRNRNPGSSGGGRGGGPSRRRASFDNNKSGGRFSNQQRNNNSDRKRPQRQINMNALEKAGLVHLYGLSSVLNALAANVRESTAIEDQLGDFAMDDNLDQDDIPTEELPERKPEAQFRPWLFVQDKEGARGGRKGSKAAAAEQVLALAEERGIPIAEVDKGVLNTLSGNRPHQGFVLRCGKLSFENVARIPHPDEDPSSPSIWLVLDEVVDPQNLGALLRTSYFLGGGDLGVLVTVKNSAPPSAVVSASSAGALELANVYSTSNLPRTLNNARSDGFRIIGASVTVPGDENNDKAPPLYELQDLPVRSEKDPRPILLVLGSEGYGLRTLVAKSCTEFVQVPGAVEHGSSLQDEFPSQAGVDSLNVSVTGGILLWHLLRGGGM